MKTVLVLITLGSPGNMAGYRTGSIVRASNGEYVCNVMTYDLKGNVLSTQTKGLGGFVEIDGNRRIRADVISKIEDDGTGGMSENNNREYSMTFTRDDEETSVYCQIGESQNPKGDNTVSVMSGDHPDLVYIHTHPSGTNGSSYWASVPSAVDISNATSTRYVISMRDKNVYLYDQTGILSVMHMDVYQNFGQIRKTGLNRLSVTNH